MSKEQDDIEKYFTDLGANRRILQSKFSVLPTFKAEELINTVPPKLTISNEMLAGEYAVGTKTNISQIEVIYPWLLKQLGVLEKPLTEFEKSSNNEASLIGSKLHQADVLFSIVMQGLRGPLIYDMLPTSSHDIVDRYIEATHLVPAGKIKNAEDLKFRLSLAWSNYHNQRGFFEPTNHVLPGFGMTDPGVTEKFFYGDKVRGLGLQLADAWIQEYIQDEPISWEFSPKKFTLREIAIAIKLRAPNLQFVGVLDSVTRDLTNKKKVRSQIVDLKTGKNNLSEKTLSAEIKMRQQQVMLILAERFTSKFLRNYNLESKNGIYPLSADHTSEAHIDRLDKAGYRWFDSKNGEFDFEQFEMTPAERQDFNEWLVWYGNMINLFKNEVKKIVKSGVQYKLDDYFLVK